MDQHFLNVHLFSEIDFSRHPFAGSFPTFILFLTGGFQEAKERGRPAGSISLRNVSKKREMELV